MVINRDEHRIKERVKALWRICFDDSDTFVELYFRLRYNDRENIAIQTGEEIVSALQMIPYPMTFCQQRVRTSYISGACTHPDHRGKGLMQQLLLESFRRMQQEGVVLSTLIPAETWLFDYYARMGYAAVFRYAETDISQAQAQPNSGVVVRYTVDNNEKIYAYLNHKMAERSCCLQHSYNDFTIILADIAIYNGQIYTAYREQQIVGLAFLYPHHDQLLIKEFLTDDDEARDALLYHIGKHHINRTLSLITPAVPNNEHLMGMARIIDAKTTLQQYAASHPAYQASIALTDHLLEANNRFFYLENGQCRVSSVPLSEHHTAVDIRELAELLLLPLHPYMSLMLN